MNNLCILSIRLCGVPSPGPSSLGARCIWQYGNRPSGVKQDKLQVLNLAGTIGPSLIDLSFRPKIVLVKKAPHLDLGRISLLETKT